MNPGGDTKLSASDLHGLYFQLEFCEPKDKVEKEQAWLNGLNRAAEERGVPLYKLKPALLKTYPRYRAARLGKEMPELPSPLRNQPL